MSNYKLAILEPYMPLKHGILAKQNHHLYGHYMILDTIDLHDFYEKVDELNNDTQNINKMYNDNLNKMEYEMNITRFHPFIRNYRNIVSQDNKQFGIQIIDPLSISIGENEWDKYSVGINKTHWIRLIQRRWRAIQEKKLQSRKNIDNLKYKEIHGQWPSECNIKFTLGLSL
jgi:hypothetical protein